MARNRKKRTDSNNQLRLNENSITYWIWNITKREEQNDCISYLLLHWNTHILVVSNNSTYLTLRTASSLGDGWPRMALPTCLHSPGRLPWVSFADLGWAFSCVWGLSMNQGYRHSDYWDFCLNGQWDRNHCLRYEKPEKEHIWEAKWMKILVLIGHIELVVR